MIHKHIPSMIIKKMQIMMRYLDALGSAGAKSLEAEIIAVHAFGKM